MTDLTMYYPITVVHDRYDGIYSGGKWIAWNLEPYEIREESQADDTVCMFFWHNCKEPYGRGDTPEEAIEDLITQLDTLLKK